MVLFCLVFVWFLFGFVLIYYMPLTITSHIIVIFTHLALISPVFLSGMLHKQLFTYNSRYASYTSLKVTDLSVRRFPSTTTVGFRINIWRPKYINSKMVSVARLVQFYVILPGRMVQFYVILPGRMVQFYVILPGRIMQFSA